MRDRQSAIRDDTIHRIVSLAAVGALVDRLVNAVYSQDLIRLVELVVWHHTSRVALHVFQHLSFDLIYLSQLILVQSSLFYFAIN